MTKNYYFVCSRRSPSDPDHLLLSTRLHSRRTQIKTYSDSIVVSCLLLMKHFLGFRVADLCAFMDAVLPAPGEELTETKLISAPPTSMYSRVTFYSVQISDFIFLRVKATGVRLRRSGTVRRLAQPKSFVSPGRIPRFQLTTCGWSDTRYMVNGRIPCLRSLFGALGGTTVRFGPVSWPSPTRPPRARMPTSSTPSSPTGTRRPLRSWHTTGSRAATTPISCPSMTRGCICFSMLIQ